MCCNREPITDDVRFLHDQRGLVSNSLMKYRDEDALNTASGWLRKRLAHVSNGENAQSEMPLYQRLHGRLIVSL